VTEFWLVRHGQTEWNTAGRLQGRLDSPLTATGREQALAAGKALAGVDFALAWCSTAPRALATAALLNEARVRPLEFCASEALAEMHFGEWEGRTKAEILTSYGEKATRFWHAPEHFEPLGGETFAGATRRITAFLEHAAALAPGRHLLVSHGMMIQLLRHAVSGLSLHHLYDQPFVVQASLTRLVVHPGNPLGTWEVLGAGEILS